MHYLIFTCILMLSTVFKLGAQGIIDLDEEAYAQTQAGQNQLLLTKADSLFALGKYAELISYLELQQEKPLTRYVAEECLLGAYYFNDHPEGSNYLLNIAINERSWSQLQRLLIEHDKLILKRYFEQDDKRSILINAIIEKYKMDPYSSNKPMGEAIIKMYIEDQWLRRYSIEWKAFDTLSKEEWEIADSINNAKVFAFYQKHKRLFSKDEVGSEMAFDQLVLLCHESNLDRRAFYLTLLQDAVKKNSFHKVSLANFRLRTEEMKDRESFFKNMNDWEDKMRVEYNLDDKYMYGIY